MKILLIDPPAASRIIRDMAGGLGFTGAGPILGLPPLELAYMAATLLRQGHEVRVFDSDVEAASEAEALGAVKAFAPEAVVGAVSLPTLYADCAFIGKLRPLCSGKVVVKTGISHGPVLKEILRRSSAELCIYGECDLNIGGILSGSDRRGAAWLEGEELKTGGDCVVEDLDSLPVPARELLRNERYGYGLLGNPAATMQTSRGCPYPCAYYCAYPLVQGKKWRRRSPGNVVDEMEMIVRKLCISKILFRDATFTQDRERIMAICAQLKARGIKADWWCETRVDRLDGELLRSMREAGCRGINIGVESGDAEVMETQAKVGLTREKLRRVRDDARAAGLKLHFLLMVGLPKETRAAIYNTYRLVADLEPESIGVTILTPYPGTPFYQEAKSRGWLETEDWSRFGGHRPVIHTDNLSADDLDYAQRTLTGLFAGRRRKSLLGRMKTALLELRFRAWAARR